MLLNMFLAALTGTAVAYIVIGLVVLRLIASRIASAAWIPPFDGIVSILLGALSIGFLNPAGVPVIGLAFAASVLFASPERPSEFWCSLSLLLEQHCAAMLPLSH